MANKPKNKKQININNPFVLLQVILLTSIRLIGVIIGTILSLLSLAVHKWVATLLITAFVLVILYTLGVI